MMWRILRTLFIAILPITTLLSLSVLSAQDTIIPKMLFASEPLKVYLSGASPVDLAYEASEPQTISIYATSLDSNESELDSIMEILDAEGNVLAENDDRDTADLNPAIEELELSAPGLYTIRLKTFQSSASGGVEVELETSLSDTPTINIGEDGECDGASLAYGDTITGTVDDDSSTEFTFCGTQGDVVTITVIATDPPSTTQDLFLILFASDGTELISDDDSATRFQFDPAIIRFELPATDTYQIEVSSNDGLSGEFTISLAED
jgi:hypothetical protein